MKHLVSMRPCHRLGAVLVYGLGLVAVVALVWSVVRAASLDRPSAPFHETPPGSADQFPEAPAGATLLPSFPRATDAALLDDVWFILDGPSSLVHRLSAAGEYLGSFGGEGDGPGEFRSGKAVLAQGDTILVAVRGGFQLYRPDGTGLGQRAMEAPDDCSLPTLADLASTDAGVLVAYACGGSEELTAVALLDSGDGSWRRLAERRDPDVEDAPWNPFAQMVVLAEHPRGFVFGNPTDKCLTIHDMGGAVVDELCHEWTERLPVQMPEGEDWDEMASEARAAGFSWELPDRYPPLDRVFMDPVSGPVYRAPTPEAIDLFRLASPDADVSAGIPPASAFFVSNGTILAIWESLDGTWAMVHDIHAG